MTYTYVLMELSQAAYDEIAAKMREAEYHHVFHEAGRIDMQGIAVVPQSLPARGEGDGQAGHCSRGRCIEKDDECSTGCAYPQDGGASPHVWTGPFPDHSSPCLICGLPFANDIHSFKAIHSSAQAGAGGSETDGSVNRGSNPGTRNAGDTTEPPTSSTLAGTGAWDKPPKSDSETSPNGGPPGESDGVIVQFKDYRRVGNGARQAVAKYLDMMWGEAARVSNLEPCDHLLAHLWNDGFKVVPVED